MKFSYKAVTKDGKTIQGIIDAKDSSEVASYLRAHEFLPIHISIKEGRSLLSMIPFIGKTGSSDLVFFTRQLASILTSGVTLMESLRILKDQVPNQAMVEITTGIIADIEGGKSLSSAISSYPKAFSPIYISLIKTSEEAGLLDKTLLRLAENLEKQQKLKATIKAALLYPVIVIVGMIIVVIIMMIVVIPQLAVVYESFNISLPLSTKIIVGMSNFFVTFWPFVFGSPILFLFIYRRWHKTESQKLIIDDLILRIPIFGKLIKQTILTEFTRTLGLLIGAGTLVVDALNKTAEAAGNTLYKNAISDIAKQVEKGISVGDAIVGYSIFPPIVSQMAKIGEQTGKLDESLLRVSEYFEREVDQTTKTLTTAMEPFIMVLLGIGVAFLIFSIITPIYTLTSSIK